MWESFIDLSEPESLMKPCAVSQSQSSYVWWQPAPAVYGNGCTFLVHNICSVLCWSHGVQRNTSALIQTGRLVLLHIINPAWPHNFYFLCVFYDILFIYKSHFLTSISQLNTKPCSTFTVTVTSFFHCWIRNSSHLTSLQKGFWFTVVPRLLRAIRILKPHDKSKTVK